MNARKLAEAYRLEARAKIMAAEALEEGEPRDEPAPVDERPTRLDRAKARKIRERLGLT